MIGPPAGVRVYLACGVTDMRKGMIGLAMLVQQVLADDPFSGALFAFRGRRAGLIKVLWHDGIGLCLLTKRLERGQFAQDFGQVVVAYGLEVDHDALVDLFQVRADEGADGEPFENEQLGHGPGRGRFAVGARHVHGRLFVLGVVHQVDQGAYPFGPGGTQALVSEDAFKVLVAVEPRQSVAEVHLSASRVIS